MQAGKFILNKTKFNFDKLLKNCINAMQEITPNHTLVKKGTLKKFIVADESRIEIVLLNHPEFFTKTSTRENFKVKLPTTFSIYGDFKVYEKIFITAQIEQKLQDNNGNTQVSAQNNYSIIPRINLGFFEGYIPITHTEFSGGNVGLGFRLGGFYMGSGSVVSALISDRKQIDFNMGFRWAFL